MTRSFSNTDLQLALDGEMPDDMRTDFELWLAENPKQKALFDRYVADRDLLKAALDPVTEEPVPFFLSKIGTVSNDNPTVRTRWQMTAAAALLLAAGGAIGYLAGNNRSAEQADAGNLLADNAINAHVIYAAEKRHTVEVGADEKDHLNAWLSKRVGRSITAPKFETYGFSLVGGRLLPNGQRPAAQFMYENTAGDRISLYVTTVDGMQETGFQLVEERHTRAYYWLDHGYACAVTGNLPQADLMMISRDAYRQLVSSDDW